MMQSLLSHQRLADFSAFLAHRMGLHYPPERWGDLERAVTQMAAELGFADADACMRHFLSAQVERTQIETLASYLTIGETYFFREPASFDALATRVLPDLLEQRRAASHRHLRIWSAACSTGEEAYSMAILLHRLIPDIQHWNITLLATDINPRSLRKAIDGRYGEWSFRGIDPEIRRAYFTLRDGRWEIAPQIRRMVTFAYHNLAEDQYPAVHNNTNAMDIIFCRNVLMYFSAERARRVSAALQHSLVEGGWLVAAAVEGSSELFAPLVNSGAPGATIYRKQPAFTLPMVSPPPHPPTPLASSPLLPEPPDPGLPPPSHQVAGEQGQALLDEATRLYQKGENAGAIALLLADPALADDARAQTLLARLYANEGQLDLAADWCRRALLIDRLSAERHYLLAMIRQECGDARGATESLKRALFLDPDFILAHVALAGLAKAEGKPSEARRCYRNALALLRECNSDDTLPEGDGLTAGRLVEIIRVASAEVRV
ncbi:CheR family methyltransferase [Niveispirillum fermenti]|uniref:CheR family methyltransferase n=1 Tax=Niveispirillum fermenti TaxID=1233113 RepID=UPI003A872CFE